MDFDQLSKWAEEEVDMILKVLPDPVKEHAKTCPIYYEAKPRSDDDLEKDVLGCFEGNSLLEESTPENMPRIRLFLENLWEYAECDTEDFRDEVGTTYLHELGHYLGWEEQDLSDRGLE